MTETLMKQIGLSFAEDIYTDVLVIGGGSAGIGSAVGAARYGKEVLVIERSSSLGGMATLAAVSTICGAYSADKSEKVIKGAYQEWMDELSVLGGIDEGVDFGQHRADICDHHLLKVAADRLLEKYKVNVLFYTDAIGVKQTDGNIDYVLISNKQGVSRVYAKNYIDCTGDADIATQCNVPYEIGDDNNKTQAATMIFKMANVNHDISESLPQEEFNNLIIRSKEKGEYNLYRPSGVFMSSAVGDSVICNMNWITEFSPLDGKEMSKAEAEGRESAVEYSKFLKAKVPGFENAYLSEIASFIGVRETRRIISDYVLTEDDIMEGKEFDDAICWSAWPVEYHDTSESKPRKTYLEQNYQIPFSTLIPKGVKNLLVAGRTISTTQFANASTRVMAPCLAIGQAAGVASGLSIDGNVEVGQVKNSTLQNELKNQGVIL